MGTGITFLLIIFYAGAVCATAWSWAAVWRGAVRYPALRDVTGIADRAALSRIFGSAGPDGAYKVTFAQVFRHRRAAGVTLSDLPVHLLFLAALAWAALNIDAPAAAAVAWVAALHALIVAIAALSVLTAGRRALIG